MLVVDCIRAGTCKKKVFIHQSLGKTEKHSTAYVIGIKKWKEKSRDLLERRSRLFPRLYRFDFCGVLTSKYYIWFEFKETNVIVDWNCRIFSSQHSSWLWFRIRNVLYKKIKFWQFDFELTCHSFTICEIVTSWFWLKIYL